MIGKGRRLSRLPIEKLNRPRVVNLAMGSKRGPELRIFSRLILEDIGHPLREIETPSRAI